MLNGLDPIIIFQFSKLAPIAGETLKKIPFLSEIPTLVDMPPIPIYLSESLTGLYIESEDKSIEIETDVQTKSDASTPDVAQKGIHSTITINLLAKKDSLALTLLSAMTDLIFDKVTSKEYAVTYMHGPITIFRGVLHSFNLSQNSENDLLNIKIELSKGEKSPEKELGPPQAERLTDAQVL